MLPKKWIQAIKKHKLIFAVGAILAIAVLVVIIPIIMGLFQQSAVPTYYDRTTGGGLNTAAEKSLIMGAPSSSMPVPTYTPAPGAGPYVEVKESSVTIETKDANGDASQIRTLTESLGGYVESTSNYEGDASISVYITSRVPSAKFQQFVDALKAQYNEKAFSVSAYRLSTARETTELDIIATSLANYAELRNRTMGIPLDEKQINLLFTLTQKELDLKSLEKQYTSSLADKQQLSDYSTVSITLTQKKEVKIMPEDLGARLRLKVKQALDDVSNSIMDLLTGSMAVFVFAIKSVVYIILFVLPLIAGYRILRKVYSWITAKI